MNQRETNDTSSRPIAHPVMLAKAFDILTQSPAYRSFPEDRCEQLAYDMVKVAIFIAGGETGNNTTRSAGPLEAIDFPSFVAGLIDGTFSATVDASIRQMEAYAELLKSAAMSVDQFSKDNISDDQARDYLVNDYPDFLELDQDMQGPKVKLIEGHDKHNLTTFFNDMGIGREVDSLDEGNIDELLVRAARRNLDKERRRLLATMILMGTNRIVVSEGNIPASNPENIDSTQPVVLEHAILEVRKGQQKAFEAAFSQAKQIITASPGFLSLQLLQCVENEGKYLLLVGWESVADHEQGFRGSPAYQEWKALLHHFYDPFPVVEHYTSVLAVNPPDQS